MHQWPRTVAGSTPHLGEVIGRLARNLFEAAIARQASRVVSSEGSDLTSLTLADLDLSTVEVHPATREHTSGGTYL